MKNTFLLLVCIWIGNAAFSQSANNSQVTYLSHYVFPEFVKGMVKHKNGSREETMLNYNSLTQEMIFIQNGTYLALDQLENIDTVIIENRKFVPAGKVFYEVATDTSIPLFVNHLCKVIPPGNPAGYGTTSQTSSNGNISQITSNSMTYALKLPDDYKLIPENEFFVKKDNEYLKINNAEQVSKAFPSKADAIQEYLKKNKTNFKNQEEVTRLIRFCNES